jgi:hypothetical protein
MPWLGEDADAGVGVVGVLGGVLGGGAGMGAGDGLGGVLNLQGIPGVLLMCC